MDVRLNYLRFLFSDKKSMPYWMSLFILIVIITFITQLMHPDDHIFWLQPLVIMFFFIAFYTQSYVKYQKYFKYQNILNEKKVQFKQGDCVVEISQQSFKTTGFKQNYYATMHIRPKQILGNYIYIKDTFILFYHIYEFGLFKRYADPIGIKLNNNTEDYLGLNKNRIILLNETQYDGDVLNIEFKKNIDAIKKLSIPDFKTYINQLS